MKIAIVGAGLAGLCAAKGLLDAGAEGGDITIFDRRAGPGLETSHANGALLHPSAVDPWNSPGILRVLVSSIGKEQSAVLLRLSALPSLLGWGWRFWRESGAARHRAHTEANIGLALRSVRLMKQWRDADGLDYGRPHAGSLVVHRSTEAMARATGHARWLAERGVASRVLSRDELVATEPALAPTATALAGGVLNLGDESGDAYRCCQALAARLASRGVGFRWSTNVRAVDRRGPGAVAGLVLADGEAPRFDAVVLAAAWWSVALAAPLGLALPIRPVKGYSITLPLPERFEDGPGPRTPVIDSDLHVALVPLRSGDDVRLRVAGTAEFCGEDRRIDPARIGNLLRLVPQVYPQLHAHVARSPRQDWTGLRPMCADGKPLVGRTLVEGLFLNTGHGQIGWTTGAASGELLASHLLQRTPALDPAPFAPSRFGL